MHDRKHLMMLMSTIFKFVIASAVGMSSGILTFWLYLCLVLVLGSILYPTPPDVLIDLFLKFLGGLVTFPLAYDPGVGIVSGMLVGFVTCYLRSRTSAVILRAIIAGSIARITWSISWKENGPAPGDIAVAAAVGLIFSTIDLSLPLILRRVASTLKRG